jgi:hypothetical protein
MLCTQSGRITLQRIGSLHEPNGAASGRRGDARDRNPSPSRTGTSMATVALYQGRGANQAPARRYNRVAGPFAAATLCGSVLLGVPPMDLTLRGLP